MKVTLCTHRFLPRFAAGVEIYTLRLARALVALGHQVHIITGEPETRPDSAIEVKEEIYEGLPVSRLCYDFERRPVSLRAAYHDPAITNEIRAVLHKLQPDVVHATSLSLLMAGTVEAASSWGLPVVYTASDYVLTCRRGTYLTWDNRICTGEESYGLCTACMGPHTPIEKGLDHLWRLTPNQIGRAMLPKLEQLISKKADFVHAAESIAHRLDYLPYWRQKISRIIAPSSHMRTMLIRNGFPTHKIIVSPYGVDLPHTNLDKTASDIVRFGFIGRVTPEKGVHLLLEAFSMLANQAQVQLTIYGGSDLKSEPYMQNLQAQAPAGVTFAGVVANSALAEIHRQLDVLVVPSIWPENSPITVLEAQAWGTPVIASNVPGMADLVQHEINGLIFSNQNAKDLAVQMNRCVETPQLIKQLAQAGRPPQSLEAETKVITRLYEEIVKP